MNATEIVELLKSFRWQTLWSMYGGAHSSIIGFISATWIAQSEGNSVLDGAPSPRVGEGREGQRNADLLLCKEDRPFIVVEVETSVAAYLDKLRSLFDYLHNQQAFYGLQLGLLVMTNLGKGPRKYRHNWDEIQSMVTDTRDNIALVSV